MFFLIALLLSMVKPHLFAFPTYLSGFENQWFGLCFFNNGDFDSFLVKWWKFNSISENSTLQLACWLFDLSISFLLTCFIFEEFLAFRLFFFFGVLLGFFGLRFRRSLWYPPPLQSELVFQAYFSTTSAQLFHLSPFLPSLKSSGESKSSEKIGNKWRKMKICAEVV